MWQKILIWLLQFTISALGENLDADTQAKVDDYNRRKTELDKIESDAAVELGKIETQIAQLDTQRTQNNDEIIWLESEIEAQDAKIRRINDDKNSKLADLHNLDDDAVLRGAL